MDQNDNIMQNDDLRQTIERGTAENLKTAGEASRQSSQENNNRRSGRVPGMPGIPGINQNRLPGKDKGGKAGGNALQNLKNGLTNGKNSSPFLNIGKRRKSNDEEEQEEQEQIEQQEQQEQNATPQDSSDNNEKKDNDYKPKIPKFGEGEEETDEVLADIKKIGKVMKVTAAVLPTAIQVLGILIVVILVFAEIMTVMDQIATFAENAVLFTERLNNFVTGKGWKTSEESFFQKLYLANDNYVGEEPLDIPLLAATVHHTVLVDQDAFDGEEGEKNELASRETSLDGDFSLFGNAVDLYHTKTFYDVASEKLGDVTGIGRFFSIGGAGLLGHLIHTGYSFETTNNLWDCLRGWAKFFGDIIDINTTGPGEIYKSNDNDLGKTLGDLTSSLGVFKLLFKANDIETKILSFMDQGQSYPEWKYRNAVYELKDLIELFKGVDDEYLMNSQQSYYSSLPTCEKCSKDGLFSIRKSDDVNDIPSDISEQELEAQAKKKKGVFPYPSVIQEQDYQAYYRYLVNIYLPITYYNGLKLGEDYTMDDLIRDANDIFDEKYTYNYLVKDNRDMSSSYRDLVESDITVNIDKNMLDNMMVNVNGATLTFKDYIVKKTYNDLSVSVSDNEEFIKAYMVFIKGEALSKNTINISNGSYSISPITEGTFADPPTGEKDFLDKIYDAVVDYYVFNSETNSFAGEVGNVGCSAGNIDHCLVIGQAKSKASNSYQWTRIVADVVFEPYGVVNISNGKFLVSKKTTISSGLELGTDGFYKRVQAPKQGEKWWTLLSEDPVNGYYPGGAIGQCVWYMYGRVGEIINNSVASQEKKQEAFDAMLKAFRTGKANGSQWFENGVCDTFACGTDPTQPRPGAIGVYLWSNSNPNKAKYDFNYGHVIVIEEVSGDNVYYSHGGNSCGGASGKSSWDCVGFWYSHKTLHQMHDLGGQYTFVGYVYILN